MASDGLWWPLPPSNVLQVNTNGFMVGDDELFTAQADTVDLMRLVGADGWPKRPLYTSRARALVHAFTQGRGYDEHDVEMVSPVLMALLHEEAAAHPTSWRRVFPPPLGAISTISAKADVEAGRKAGRDALEDVGGMLTDLDEATRQFVEWLEQSANAKKLLEEHLSAAEDAIPLHAHKSAWRDRWHIPLPWHLAPEHPHAPNSRLEGSTSNRDDTRSGHIGDRSMSDRATVFSIG